MAETDRATAIRAELARRKRIRELQGELSRRQSLKAQSTPAVGSPPAQASAPAAAPVAQAPVPAAVATPPVQEQTLAAAPATPEPSVAATPKRKKRKGVTGFFMDQLDKLPEGVKEAGRIAGEASFFNEAPGAVKLLTPTSDNLGSQIGEIAGRAGGFALGGPVGSAAGGAAGAGIGLMTSRALKGEPVTWSEIATEVGLSVIPDVLERGGKAVARGARKAQSRTSAGRAAGADLGGRKLKEIGKTILKPKPKDEVDGLFDMVRASGHTIAPSSIAPKLKAFEPDQYKDIQQALKGMASPPGQGGDGFQKVASQVFEAIRTGKPAPGLDIGDLQHVRSQINKIAATKKEGRVADSLSSFAAIIDDAIINGRVMRRGVDAGEGGTVGVLKQARNEYRKLRETEDIGAFFNRVAKLDKSAKNMTLDLGKLTKAMESPTEGIEKRAVDALSRDPGAKAEIEQFLKNMGKVDISASDAIGKFELLNGVAAIVRAGPMARTRFNQIVNGEKSKGRQVTVEAIKFMANAARRGAFKDGSAVNLTPGEPRERAFQ